jgi:hypothetical protein
MADKTAPRGTKDPWADSVRHKEQQGQLRDSHDTKKLQSEKDARRRDEQSVRRGQNKNQARGSSGKTQRGNR